MVIYSRKRELPNIDLERSIIQVCCRPFDNRYTIYNRNVLVHPREQVTRHLLCNNVALCIPKNQETIGSHEFDGAFCADRPVDLDLFRAGEPLSFRCGYTLKKIS